MRRDKKLSNSKVNKISSDGHKGCKENKTRVTSLPWTTHLLVGRSLPPKRRPLSAQMDDVFTVDIGLTGLANREV